MKFNIVIIGAGEVGFNLAKALSKEDHSITVIDINSEKCKRIIHTIDAHVIEGDGCSQRILQNIEMDKTDYLLALTRIDEVNLVASNIGREMGAKKVICRLRNTEYSHKNTVIEPDQFGINHIVFPEKAACNEIKKLITLPSTIDVQTFYDEKISLAGILLEESSTLLGRTALNVELSNPYIPHKLAAIYRGDSTFIPHKDTKYKKNDIAYFVGPTEILNDIQIMSGKSPIKVKNIMILGAGKLGRLLAKSLQDDYNVTILEKDKNKADTISERIKNTLMLIGDGLDIAFLESENISEFDCFIALSENEQTNILASLLLKHYGLKQVITHINTTDYLKAVRRIGIDAVISKNNSAVNEVLKIIRSDEDEVAISRFDEIDIESVELIVTEDSDFIKKNYTVENLPENICLGAIIRNENVIIPKLHTDLRIEDKLLFFTKPEHIHKAEELFK